MRSGNSESESKRRSRRRRRLLLPRRQRSSASGVGALAAPASDPPDHPAGRQEPPSAWPHPPHPPHPAAAGGGSARPKRKVRISEEHNRTLRFLSDKHDRAARRNPALFGGF